MNVQTNEATFVTWEMCATTITLVKAIYVGL